MEENYIQIFCSTVAQLLESDQITEEDMRYLIVEFEKVAAGIHDRAALLDFIGSLRPYPQLDSLIAKLQDSHYQFNF